MQTIIAVEDEVDILELVEYTLSKSGYDVIGLLDTSKVKILLNEEDIALILMDRNLPNCEGSLYIKNLRKQGYNTPVIYLSAKDSSEDILEGFERGADDYITKPFNPEELKARVTAVLKRAGKLHESIKYKDILFDKSNSKVFINKKEIKLSKLEKKLLYEFLTNINTLLSRETLLENVWEESYDKQIKTVNVAIKRLKQKIDPDNKKEYIKSIRGEGYILC